MKAQSSSNFRSRRVQVFLFPSMFLKCPTCKYLLSAAVGTRKMERGNRDHNRAGNRWHFSATNRYRLSAGRLSQCPFLLASLLMRSTASSCFLANQTNMRRGCASGDLNARANHPWLIDKLSDKRWRMMHERAFICRPSPAPADLADELIDLPANAVVRARDSRHCYRLIAWVPAFASAVKSPPAPSRMLTEDWQRVGYPPFNFLTS